MVADWREIDGFPDYSVNEYGEILNNRRNIILRPRVNKQGFLMVGLCREKKQFTKSVAYIVGETFLPPKRNHLQNSIIHLNGDREDCRASNLMWRPRWFSIRYHQMFDDLPFRVRVRIQETGERFASLREFCTTYGCIERHAFHDMNNGERVYPYGFYLEKY